ncbi:MAG: saccharopine dehydrogenase NADP-binding domain-containing protein [Deltaproteobacteria bacterium]|nr:saccharopine dehydrogenase NADP-binding domain-containing protein [Deltaproteobacteria bacterium]
MMNGNDASRTRWLIYGANGYTGELIAEEARKRGHTPIVAGRNREAVTAVGRRFALESRVFELAHGDSLATHLKDIDLVINCAGPFSATAKPMLEGCTRSGTHYLDITGETDVFELVHGESARYADAGVVAMPGVGFDVVPSDCLAALLKARMPDATRLRLAFKSLHGKWSPGTTKTMIEGLPRGGLVRKDGKLTKVRAAHKVILVPFEGPREQAVSIPWGDVSTAYHSTGIGNVEVFIGLPPAMIWQFRASAPLAGLTGVAAIQRFLKGQANRRVKGRSESERASSAVILWGEVRNAEGKKQALTIRTPEAYTLTAVAAVRCAERVLAGEVKPGAVTPSMAFGGEFVLSLPGVSGPAAAS